MLIANNASNHSTIHIDVELVGDGFNTINKSIAKIPWIKKNG